jgi:hypothetical protein
MVINLVLKFILYAQNYRTSNEQHSLANKS